MKRTPSSTQPATDPPQKRRGRPPKVKPEVAVEVVPAPVLKRKDKPPKKIKAPVVKVEEPPKAHEIQIFVDYLYAHIDDMELRYYKRYATKGHHGVKYTIAKAIVDFFRIKDSKFSLNTINE